MTLRLSSDKTPVGGAQPPGHAPDPTPPSAPQESFGTSTGAIPPHNVPSLTQLCHTTFERVIANPTRKDCSALGTWLGQGMPPDIQVPDPVKEKPKISLLLFASTIGPLHFVKLLVDKEQVPDFQCLERAFAVNQDPAVFKFISKFAIDTAKPSTGNTLLQSQCGALKMDKVKLLLEAGADVNKRTEKFPSPLAIVTLKRVWKPGEYDRERRMAQLSIMDMLLKKGANPNEVFENPEFCPKPLTLLDIAAKNGDTVVVALLRKYGGKTTEELFSSKRSK
jgi:hypothetical protein